MHKGTYIIIIPVLLIVNNIFQKYYHLNRKLIFIFTLKWKVAFEKMLLYLQWQSMESIQIKTFMNKFFLLIYSRYEFQKMHVYAIQNVTIVYTARIRKRSVCLPHICFRRSNVMFLNIIESVLRNKFVISVQQGTTKNVNSLILSCACVWLYVPCLIITKLRFLN